MMHLQVSQEYIIYETLEVRQMGFWAFCDRIRWFCVGWMSVADAV